MRVLAVIVVAVASLFAPQGKKSKDAVCPYCKNDPALMKAAGVVSHGPFPIAQGKTDDLVATLPTSLWIFLETPHLRWASCLGEDTVEQKDRERVDAELAQLRAALPDVPLKPKKLDPWLRLHLFAMKGESFYAHFEDVLHVKDGDFPSERKLDEPYMGAGKFLGEKDKFEVVIHQLRDNHRRFTTSFSGVVSNDSFRWHFKDLHKLLVSIPAEDSDLREDRWLWPHAVHCLSHAFLDAYKHFAYHTPVWLDEGLAAALEKEVDPQSRTLEGEEGGYRDNRGPSDFGEAARKLADSGKAPTLAQLWNAKEYSELGLDGTIAAWSITHFLIEQHGEKYARFLGGVKGQLDANGQQTGADLPGLQRKLLKELWGWTPAELDTAWLAWVRGQK